MLFYYSVLNYTWIDVKMYTFYSGWITLGKSWWDLCVVCIIYIHFTLLHIGTYTYTYICFISVIKIKRFVRTQSSFWTLHPVIFYVYLERLNKYPPGFFNDACSCIENTLYSLLHFMYIIHIYDTPVNAYGIVYCNWSIFKASSTRCEHFTVFYECPHPSPACSCV